MTTGVRLRWGTAPKWGLELLGGRRISSQNCQSCGRISATKYVRYCQIIGLIVVAYRQIYAGQYCAECARRIYRKTLTANLLLGFFSMPSLIATPIILFQNRKSYLRFKQPPGSSPTDGLPWAVMMSAQDDGPGIGQQKLTWPMAIGTFISFGLVIFLPVTCIPSQNRLMPFGVSLSGSVLLLCGLALCIFWHRHQRNRPDLAADVLGQLFPMSTVMQTGRVHFTVLGFQSGPSFRLLVAVQNLFAQPTHFSASFENAGTLPDLNCDLAASQVILAANDFAISSSKLQRQKQLMISAAADGTGGTKIRFAARREFRGQSKTSAVSLAMAIGGHGEINLSSSTRPGLYFADIDGRLAAPLLPFDTHINRGPARRWTITKLWEAQRPQSADQAAQTILRALGTTGDGTNKAESGFSESSALL